MRDELAADLETASADLERRPDPTDRKGHVAEQSRGHVICDASLRQSISESGRRIPKGNQTLTAADSL